MSVISLTCKLLIGCAFLPAYVLLPASALGETNTVWFDVIRADPNFEKEYGSAFNASGRDAIGDTEEIREVIRTALDRGYHAGPDKTSDKSDDVAISAFDRIKLQIDCPNVQQNEARLKESIAHVWYEAFPKQPPSARILGALTGTTMGIARVKGAICLCSNGSFQDVIQSCMSSAH